MNTDWSAGTLAGNVATMSSIELAQAGLHTGRARRHNTKEFGGVSASQADPWTGILGKVVEGVAADAKKISRPDMDPKAQMSPSSRMSNNYTYAVTWNRRFSEGAKAVVGERKLG